MFMRRKGYFGPVASVTAPPAVMAVFGLMPEFKVPA
jgi:hypothetical protein